MEYIPNYYQILMKYNQVNIYKTKLRQTTLNPMDKKHMHNCFQILSNMY